MTSPISNPLSSYMRIPEETISSNHQPQVLFIEESHGDSIQTSKWEVARGIYRRVCGLFPEWKVSRRDLLVEVPGCLAVAILVTFATRSLIRAMDSEMVEFIKNQAEEVRQSVMELIKNEGEEITQRWIEDIKKWNGTEEVMQHLIEVIKEEVKNETEKDLQFYEGNLKNQTEKIMQIFTDPKLGEENFGGFWWPTGVTFTIVVVSRAIMGALKLYFPD